jgi:peptidyl-prolyl cis-trans isomerase D
MAVIGAIRDKGRYVLIGFVGLALVTFILTGFFDSFGSGPTQVTFGTVAGEDVNMETFNKYVNQIQMNDMQQAQQQGREYTERDAEESANRAWQLTVDEQLLEKEYEALGIDVSDQEFTSYLYGEDGFSLMPDIQQNFSDPTTGKLNVKQLEKFIADREKATDPQQAQQWKDTKDGLKKNRKQEKYFQIMSQGLYVTKLEAKQEYKSQKEVKSISFVMGSFRDIEDNKIKVTDDEIRKYWEENKDKKKFEVMAGRDVKYFDILIQPSKRDSMDFNKVMTKLKKEFAASTNDSVFVMTNSDVKVYGSNKTFTFRPAGDQKARPGMTYPIEMDTVFKTATVGQIVGPYYDNGKTRIAKVLDFNDKLMKVRHILVGDQSKKPSDKKLADSIAKVVNKTNFEALVKKYSKDQGSVEKGGVYEDFRFDEMVEPFAKFSYEEPIGKVGVVETQFGWHVIEVLDRKDGPKFPVLAVIEKTLTPSEETNIALKDKVYNLLYKFEQKISATEDMLAKLNLFDTLAKKENFFARPVRMLDEAPRVQGFNTKLAEQKILELAYGTDAEVGQLCPSPIQDKDRYIIAMISSIRQEGAPSFEDAYVQMKGELIKEKKAARIKAKIGSARNLNVVAKRLRTSVNQSDVTFANPNIQGGGVEYEIVGSLFSGLKDGKTTIPLVGTNGVYVIKLNKTVKAPAAANYDAERTQLLAQLRGNAASDIRRGLQKKYKVIDNRRLAELGLANPLMD